MLIKRVKYYYGMLDGSEFDFFRTVDTPTPTCIQCHHTKDTRMAAGKNGGEYAPYLPAV